MNVPAPLHAVRLLSRLLTCALAIWGAVVAPELSAVAQEPPPWQITEARLGFRGAFKLGCWTQLRVTLAGGTEQHTGHVEAVLADADGVAATFRSPPARPVGLFPNQTTETSLLVRVGQRDAPLELRFVGDDGQVHAKRTIEFGYPLEGDPPGDGVVPWGLPATARLMAAVGNAPGLAEIVRAETVTDVDAETQSVTIDDPSDLPLSWLGYEGLDTLILASRQIDFFRQLAADSPRMEAITQWVDLGGKVVVVGGAESEEAFGASGALARLLPGTFAGLAPLRDRDSTPIETFSGTSDSIARGRLDIRVARIRDVRGEILAYAGLQPTDLPLVVRERRGLGLITFTAFDPEADPLDRWSGRQSLLRRLVGWPLSSGAQEASNPMGQAVYSDLSNQLRAALDNQFLGVTTAPFAVVALLVVIYILLIGPGDYFLVTRILKRTEATWITFPLIALAVSGFAYWLAGTLKGDQLRVNQVEIVDVDLGAKRARGTVWTHFFSPRVQRYDLALAPHLGSTVAPGATSAVAWLGTPGSVMGGMQGQGQGLFNRGYALAPDQSQLMALPVQEWSTKTITARWHAEGEPLLAADLRLVRDELLAGSVTNRAGFDFQDCLLMHGNWAYRLTTLAAGASRQIDDGLQPRTVKTLLTNAAAGDDSNVRTADDGTVAFQYTNQDVARIVKAMMFYDAVGGAAYTVALNRYQEFVDLSALLEGPQAILLARAPAEVGSQWFDGETPLQSDQDRRWVYYRFVIPLQDDSNRD